MGAPVTTDSIWEELGRQTFAVLGMVNAKGEARTAGIVYTVHQRKLYIATDKESWKAKHVGGNGHVSLTICIPKRVPFLPFVHVPAATITCHGSGRVLAYSQAPAEVTRVLARGLEETGGAGSVSIIEVSPEGEFVTYGVGVSMLTMRKTQAARGRAAVA
ncbi:MAG: pyridoxamine 5'-phosphate oxidase family protein [Myxococcales bacterium]|nr:pyridoxamine 5'-phosphate oxidase family protein [Myxococcales bacterium]MDD9967276.1 pyridoxamine 5'-phosphate oxidase family protein [Myxococcales bacterium]